jgi:hypothetical protein
MVCSSRVGAALLVALLTPAAIASTQDRLPAGAAAGREHLLRRAYAEPELDQKTLDSLWTVWEPEWKSKVKEGDLEQIRALTRERYGFPAHVDPKNPFPVSFVSTERGLTLNCLACHAGRLPGSGETMIGLPNTEIDMPTFLDDAARLAGQAGTGSNWGMTRGRTNAFFLSHIVLMRRGVDMSPLERPVNLGSPRPADLDAPPWWHARRKQSFYSDAFVEGGHGRAMMQFAMAARVDGPTFRSWEKEFDEILAYLRTIQPPKYPWPLDRKAAAEGEKVFARECAGCHGTYGPDGKYPGLVISLDVVGTDPVRLKGMTPEFRRYYAKSWLGQKSKVVEAPEGYVAPPLDGIWATAPYFHNGSVPTVYGVLTEAKRPKYFRRVGAPQGYDQQDLGITVEVLTGPAPADAPAETRRRVVDTTLPGLGNGGHPFGFHLTEAEKRQVIEYLKTL